MLNVPEVWWLFPYHDKTNSSLIETFGFILIFNWPFSTMFKFVHRIIHLVVKAIIGQQPRSCGHHFLARIAGVPIEGHVQLRYVDNQSIGDPCMLQRLNCPVPFSFSVCVIGLAICFWYVLFVRFCPSSCSMLCIRKKNSCFHNMVRSECVRFIVIYLGKL